MSETKKDQEAVGRRGFLKAMTGATALAATAVVGAGEAEAQATRRETRDERRRARYQGNSKHVQDFYRTNRY